MEISAELCSNSILIIISVATWAYRHLRFVILKAQHIRTVRSCIDQCYQHAFQIFCLLLTGPCTVTHSFCQVGISISYLEVLIILVHLETTLVSHTDRLSVLLLHALQFGKHILIATFELILSNRLRLRLCRLECLIA